MAKTVMLPVMSYTVPRHLTAALLAMKQSTPLPVQAITSRKVVMVITAIVCVPVTKPAAVPLLAI